MSLLTGIFGKIGMAFAWLVAIGITAFLLWIIWLGVHNRFAEGDSAGWATMLMPLVALIPLATTIPYVLKVVYRAAASGKLWQTLSSVPVLVIAYAVFAWTLFVTYSLQWQESPLLPVFVLWLSGTLIIGSMIRGLMRDYNAKVIFIVTAAILASVTLVPMAVIMQELATSKETVSVSYGEPFNPLEMKIYEFPDFRLKPLLQPRGYSMEQKDTGKILSYYLGHLCAHNNELWTDCEDFSNGYGYQEDELVSTAVNGKLFVARPIGEQVKIEVQLPYSQEK